MSQAAIFSLISAIMTVVVLPILSVVLHKNTRKTVKTATRATITAMGPGHEAFKEAMKPNNPDVKP